MAAGFALPSGRIAELETRFERTRVAVLKPHDLDPVLRVDAEVSGADIDWPLFEASRRWPPLAAAIPHPSWRRGTSAFCWSLESFRKSI